jgi:hypothetical protein
MPAPWWRRAQCFDPHTGRGQRCACSHYQLPPRFCLAFEAFAKVPVVMSGRKLVTCRTSRISQKRVGVAVWGTGAGHARLLQPRELHAERLEVIGLKRGQVEAARTKLVVVLIGRS